MARFYIEGDEVDVQDPTFHYTKAQAIKHHELLESYLNDYADAVHLAEHS